MSRLLILPAFLLTLFVATPAFSDSSEEYDDVEIAKAEWSESVFVKSPLWCEKPTEECFRRVDQSAQAFLSSLYSIVDFRPALRQRMRNFRNCISKVEDTKRHRALLEFAKDNPYKWHLEIYLFWSVAMEKKFPHCAN